MEIKSIFRSPPQLHTDRLTLRKLIPRDKADMFEYARDPEVTKFLTWRPHASESYTNSYLIYVQSQYRAKKFFDWAVTCTESGKMIGTCGFTRLDEVNLCGEVGYVISPLYQNRGIATEALREVIRFGFEELSLERIEARYMIGNDASRAVMEKCGMSFEGVLRQCLYTNERFVDVGICSILRSEHFREIK